MLITRPYHSEGIWCVDVSFQPAHDRVDLYLFVEWSTAYNFYLEHKDAPEEELWAMGGEIDGESDKCLH